MTPAPTVWLARLTGLLEQLENQSFDFWAGHFRSPETPPIAIVAIDNIETYRDILSGMLDEGAGDLTSEQFQAKVSDLNVKLSFDADRDSFTASFATLTENREDLRTLVADLYAFCAAFLSPSAIALRTRLIAVRMRERKLALCTRRTSL